MIMITIINKMKKLKVYFMKMCGIIKITYNYDDWKIICGGDFELRNNFSEMVL